MPMLLQPHYATLAAMPLLPLFSLPLLLLRDFTPDGGYYGSRDISPLKSQASR